jgi:hypothetical protein
LQKRPALDSPADALDTARLNQSPNLFSAQKANSRRESAPVEVAEGQELRGVNVTVHGERILMVRNVVEATA